MTQIVPAEKLEAKIRSSNDIVELKEIHDKAEAIRVYVGKFEKNFVKQNKYAELKIRAERRCGEILATEIQHGGDRKSKSRFDRKTLKDLGISKNQSHRWQTIAQLSEEAFEGHIAKTKDLNKELTSASVYRIANEDRKRSEAEAKPIPGAKSIKTPINIKTITGDFMESIDRFENVDAIITDPPYSKEFLPLYGQLAQFSAKVLKPGGSLLVMAGVYYLPQVFELMTPHLNYHWTITYHMPRRPRREWQKKILNTWKPILWFVKGKYEGEWNKDVIEAGGIEKNLHPWQQTSMDLEKLVEKTTCEGSTIIDPFFGTGSLGLAAIKLNREIIGIEIDPKRMKIAEERLEWFAKKIVLPSFFPNEDPTKVLENWKKNNDASGIKSTSQSDQEGIFHIKLAEQKPEQTKKTAASSMDGLKNKSKKPLTTKGSKNLPSAKGNSKNNDVNGKRKKISGHKR